MNGIDTIRRDFILRKATKSAYRSRYALYFDALNNLVNMGSPTALDNIWDGGATALAWIYPRSDGENNTGVILSKYNSSTGWYIHVTAESGSIVKLRFVCFFDGGGGAWFMNTLVIPLNEWSLVAVSFDNSSPTNNPTMWVDAVTETATESQTPIGTRTSDASNSLLWGNWVTENLTFDGEIRDVAFINGILTQSEIEKAYGSGSPIDISKSSFSSDVISWYPSSGYVYPTVSDAIGSNDGTMTNMDAGDIVSVW